MSTEIREHYLYMEMRGRGAPTVKFNQDGTVALCGTAVQQKAESHE